MARALLLATLAATTPVLQKPTACLEAHRLLRAALWARGEGPCLLDVGCRMRLRRRSTLVPPPGPTPGLGFPPRLTTQPMGETMVVHTEPASVCAAACTVHALPPPPPPVPPEVIHTFLSRPGTDRRTPNMASTPPSPSPPSPLQPQPQLRPPPPPDFLSSCRVIAGIPAMLLLAARDAPGNLRPSPPSSWSVSIEAAEGEAPPPLCARVERTEGERRLLAHRAAASNARLTYRATSRSDRGNVPGLTCRGRALPEQVSIACCTTRREAEG